MRQQALIQILLGFTLFVVSFGAIAQTPTQPADEFPIPALDNPFPLKVQCDVVGTTEPLTLRFEPSEKNLVTVLNRHAETEPFTVLAEGAMFDDTASDAVYMIRHLAGTEQLAVVSTFVIGRFWPGGRQFNPGKMLIQQATLKKNPETGADEYDVQDLGSADLKCFSYE